MKEISERKSGGGRDSDDGLQTVEDSVKKLIERVGTIKDAVPPEWLTTPKPERLTGEYLDYAVRLSGMPVIDCEWSKCRVAELLREWLRRSEWMIDRGKGLLLMGPVGTGKTSAAALIAKELLASGSTVRWVYMADMLGVTSDRFKREAEIRRQQKAEVLVWDDFGVTAPAPWQIGYLDRIVDARYRMRRSMIVTTNLTRDQLRSVEDGARMIDRWRETMQVVTISGQSMRVPWKMSDDE